MCPCDLGLQRMLLRELMLRFVWLKKDINTASMTQMIWLLMRSSLRRFKVFDGHDSASRLYAGLCVFARESGGSTPGRKRHQTCETGQRSVIWKVVDTCLELCAHGVSESNIHLLCVGVSKEKCSAIAVLPLSTIVWHHGTEL
eukprot:521376-Amphidinium_carterae.3